jgi:hypothetical protein
MSALSATVCAEKTIYIWMSYIRTSGEDGETRRREMTDVLNVFLEWLPMDIGSARGKSGTWRDQRIEVIKSLRNIKTFLNLMEPGAAYLAPDEREVLDEWLGIRPALP